VDQRTSRVVDPARILGLVVGERERYTALQLVYEREDPGVPERDVTQHAGDGPVRIHLAV